MQYYVNPWELILTFKLTGHHCPQVHLSTLPPEPVIPSKKPFKVELVGGKRYSWCTCGHSKKQVNKPKKTNTYDLIFHGSCLKVYKRYIFSNHIFFLSAFLWRRTQNQSSGPVPSTLLPRERLHSLVVRMQAHEQPALLRRYAQAGLHRVRPFTRTHRFLIIEH